jgi:hypothetical protein
VDGEVDLNAVFALFSVVVATLVLEMIEEMSHRLIDLTEAKDQQSIISYDSKLRSQDMQYSPC